MGNTNKINKTDKRLLIKNYKLKSGYICNYWTITSAPEGIKREPCIILDHTKDFSKYTIKHEKNGFIQKDVPFFYLSPRRIIYSWEDYFKVGSKVKSTVVSKSPTPAICEIVFIKDDVYGNKIVCVEDCLSGNYFELDYKSFMYDTDQYNY